MARRGEVTYYYTGNPTVPWPRRPDVAAVGADTVLARSRPDYVLATKAMGIRLDGVSLLINDACERLSVEFAAPPHTLLVEVHAPDDPPARNACALAREYFSGPPGG